MGLMDDKVGLIMGVANDRSIAWAISQSLYAEGAKLAFTHVPYKSSERWVRRLTEPYHPEVICSCDVQSDDDLDAVFEAVGTTYGRLDFLVHSVAFAPPNELREPYYKMSREGWRLAMDISAYSLVAATQRAVDLMPDGGNVLAITYFGGEKVIPDYNMMGVCKAALEHSVRYLAWDLGERKIRVNALSAGPMRTLSSAGLTRFEEMQDHHARKAPLRRSVELPEIGNTALYLLSHLSSAVTGENVHVDCGFSTVGV